jgi:hypothetical protein
MHPAFANSSNSASTSVIIVGGRRGNTGRYEAGQTLFDLSPTTEKDFFVVQGAGHSDMYYKDEHVNQAIDRLAPFYSNILVHRQGDISDATESPIITPDGLTKDDFTRCFGPPTRST